MKRAAVVILCFILSVFAGTSFATEVTLLGPNQYDRTSGDPDVFTASFTAISGEGTLIVKNGSIDGTDRITDAISSASVYVNGEQIFGPRDFNQNVYLLQAPVNLLENNSVTVELASGPLSYIRVEIKQEQQQEQPTVTLSADPETILLGESATLTWNSTNADTCVFEPDIGTVDVNGSIEVLPTETTVYAITATGAGGTATDSVTVTATHPAPTVSISTDPEIILIGESSFLSWNSTNATSCVIEPDIGAVDVNGTISVSPAETTTYTITATGLGGTTMANVTITVTYPPPTVSINADPETIQAGGSSTLTWNSTNADSAVIDQEIGSVAANGSVTVSPAETTTYAITVTGPGGTATADVTVTVSPLSISIISPLDGDTISRPDTMVQGTITNPLGNEVGVNINGIIAMVYGDQFVANHVPLKEGENTVTAIATDTVGNTATASIIINSVTTERYIRITANTESSVSPLETALGVEGSFSFAESSTSCTGPGAVEFLDSTNDNEYNVKMITPGIYFFTGEVTDDQGNIYTDTMAIVVFDKAQLDALLREKWDGMKTALGGGDLDGALAYFAHGTKDNYQQIFTLLPEDKLQKIATEMREIEKIHFEENRAKYGINREETVQGVLHDITYIIYFVKDGDGLWKIESF